MHILAEDQARAKGHDLTLPPIMTVLGTKSLAGSFFIPAGQIRDSSEVSSAGHAPALRHTVVTVSSETNPVPGPPRAHRGLPLTEGEQGPRFRTVSRVEESPPAPGLPRAHRRSPTRGPALVSHWSSRPLRDRRLRKRWPWDGGGGTASPRDPRSPASSL